MEGEALSYVKVESREAEQLSEGGHDDEQAMEACGESAGEEEADQEEGALHIVSGSEHDDSQDDASNR